MKATGIVGRIVIPKEISAEPCVSARAVSL